MKNFLNRIVTNYKRPAPYRHPASVYEVPRGKFRFFRHPYWGTLYVEEIASRPLWNVLALKLLSYRVIEYAPKT